MPVIFDYWHKIYNDKHEFNREQYMHRYRGQISELSQATFDLPFIAGHELMAFVKKMAKSSPGLDGRSVQELRALPLDIWNLVALFWEQTRLHPDKVLPDQFVTAGVHLIPKPGASG